MVALVTAPDPVVPEMGVGPAPARVQSVASAVPPLSLTTVLTRVRCAAGGGGALSSLVMVQVALSPSARVPARRSCVLSPVQAQSEAVYPVGPPVSDRV